MFSGFSPRAIEFLWNIRFNNERPWFEAHKQEYLELVAKPMKELGVQIQRELLERFPDEMLELKVSRIYRDARRLHGRGPYKDHMWFVLRRPRDGGIGPTPCFYFEIAPEYHSMGMGYYSATPLTMAKFRARIDRDPETMEKLARGIEEQDRFCLEGERYARPKGSINELLEPWYNRKTVSLSWDRNCEGSLFTSELSEEILEGFTFLMPYFKYFDSLDGDKIPGE